MCFPVSRYAPRQWNCLLRCVNNMWLFKYFFEQSTEPHARVAYYRYDRKYNLPLPLPPPLPLQRPLILLPARQSKNNNKKRQQQTEQRNHVGKIPAVHMSGPASVIGIYLPSCPCAPDRRVFSFLRSKMKSRNICLYNSPFDENEKRPRTWLVPRDSHEDIHSFFSTRVLLIDA